MAVALFIYLFCVLTGVVVATTTRVFVLLEDSCLQ